jgi:hypothetical protein
MSSAGIDVVIPWQPSMAAIVALLLAIAAPAAAADPYAATRLEMVRTIEAIASEAGGGATPTVVGRKIAIRVIMQRDCRCDAAPRAPVSQ